MLAGASGRRTGEVPAPASPRRDRALEDAIRRDRIELRFQPQIEPASGRIAGVEALARWSGAESPEESVCPRRSRRPCRAAVAPDPAQGAAHRRRLARTARRAPLSINLLPRDLDRPGYEQWLLEEIAAAGLKPERITAEIVESSLMADSLTVAGRLARLRAAGVRIAIDDFGTGYSSLAYLTSLPLDAIKIDRAMIADIVGGSRDRIVVKAMIRLARELGLKVVVEGVENLGPAAPARGMGLRPLPGLPRRRRARRGRADALRDGGRANRRRLGRLELFLRFTRRQHPHQAARNLQRAVQPRLAGRPVAADDQLAVGPQLRRALQPLDIGEQAGRSGKLSLWKVTSAPFGADVELGDHRLACN